MFDQTIFDTLILIGMFVLRIGVPVAVLFGIAAWLEKKLRPQETQKAGERPAPARIIPFISSRKGAVKPPGTIRASTEDSAKRANVK